MSSKRRYLPYLIGLAVIGLIVALLSFEFGEDAATHLRVANVLLDEGFLEEALWEYERALEIDPTNYEAAVGRLYAMAGTYRLQAAEERFSAARDANPRDAFYAFQLALFYALHLDFHSAQEQLGDADENGLDRAWHAYGQGVIYAASGQLKNAVEEFSKAIAIDPDLGPAYVRLADAHINRGELMEARRTLMAGITNSESNAYRLHPRLAWLSISEGNTKLALQELKSILTHADQSTSCYYSAALIALNLELPLDSTISFEDETNELQGVVSLTELEPAERLAVLIIGDSLESDPLEARSHYHIADILYQVGATEQAREQLSRSALQAPPTSWYEGAEAEFHRWRADSLLISGDYDAARLALHKLISSRPDDTNARYQLARTYDLEGAHPAAVEHYEAMIEFAPDDPRGYLGLARIHAERGEIEQAVTRAETAVIKNPVDLSAQKDLVSYYIDSRRFNRAATVLDNLVMRLPSDPELEILRGRLAEARGDTIAAVDYYQRALNLGLAATTSARLHFSLSRLYQRRAESAEDPDESERFSELAERHTTESISLTDTASTL
ncbi:MAG: tetratricopeptide repeat protein [Candidatus Coatesbacteria bacterium]|nr:tetratricopeptide repeat protein [Candidatus Coatesbacteria bacterium]